jgi:hypothetical protein
MPLPPRRLEFDPALLVAGRSQLPSTLGESVTATVQDPILAPTKELGMVAEQQRLGGSPYLSRFLEATAKFSSGLPMSEPEPLTPAQKELVSPDQVKQEYGHLGLSYTEPTPRAVVDYDAATKRAEARRQEILANAPGGLAAGAIRLGAGFGRAAVDPLNLASAVIPVLGPVSRSALTMRAGRFGAKALEGAGAGFIGAAAVEPATYGLSRQLQLDYDMGDAMANLIFGTVLGGGLHVAAGFTGDALIRASARRRVGRLDDSLARGADLDPNALPGDIVGDFRSAQGNRAMVNAMIPQGVRDFRGIEANVNAQFRRDFANDTRRAIQPAATLRASPEALRDTFHTAIAQTLSGQQVNVAPILEVDRALQEAAGPDPRTERTARDQRRERQARGHQAMEGVQQADDPLLAPIEARLAKWRELKARGRGRPPKDDPLATTRQELANAGITSDMTEAQARAQAEIVERGNRRRRVLSRAERAQAIAPHTEAIRTMAAGRSDWEEFADQAARTFDEEPPKEQWGVEEAEELDLASVDLLERAMVEAREELDEVPEIAEAIQRPGKQVPGPEKPPGPGAAPKPAEGPAAPPKPPGPDKIKPYSAKASDAIPAGKVGADGEAGVFEFDASELEVDAQRFQFKAGGDEFGVSDKLKHIKTFSRSKAGQLIVWESLEGKVYVANGHQRVALAKRVKANDPKADTTVSAVLYREKDGVTADDVMVIAAAANIAEGSGSVIDMAKIARLHPEMMGEAMRVSDEKQRMAFDLTQLSDSSFGMVVNEVVPYQYAAMVGRFLPDDEVRQTAAMGLLAKAEPASMAEAQSLVQQVAAEEVNVETQTGLFGDEQIATSLVIEKSKVMAAVGKLVRQDRKIFNALVKESERIEAAGNVLKGEENAARASKAGELLQTIEALAYRKGPISDALTQAAQDVKAGVNAKTAARGFAENVRRANEAERAARGEPGQPRGARGDQPAGEQGFSKGVAKPSFAEDDLTSAGPLTKGEKAAVEAYYQGSDRINDDLRGGKVPREARALDSAIAKSSLSRPTTVYRGIKWGQWSAIEPLLKRGSIKDSGFLSTARSHGSAAQFGDVVLEINLPEGFPALAIGRMGEGELLLPRGTRFRVASLDLANRKARLEPMDSLPKGVEAPPSALKASFADEPQTSTPAFKRWFGDSNMKTGDAFDADGRPLDLGNPADLTAAIISRLPEGVRTFLNVDNAKHGLPAGLQGLAETDLRVILVTTRALDPVATLRHEEIHMLRGLGLFTDDEWALLAERAGRLSDWTSPKLEEHYRGWWERGDKMTPEQVEEQLLEEAVARMVEGYRGGARYGKAIDTIIAKIGEFLDALRNAARGLGFQTADDVIRRIEAGEVGRRAQPPREGAGGLKAKLIEDVATGREFAASQPARDFDEIYKLAPLHQVDLLSKAKAIADSLPDTRFEFPPAEVSEPGMPGVKKRAAAEAKIGRKGYKSTSQLTDVVRVMFISGKPEFGDSVVRELAKHYDIFDEGWAMTPSGYFDRKVLVRFDDGMIGEVQIQEPHLTEAKMQKGGHLFYEHERALPPGDPKRAEWVQKQRDLYAEAVAAVDPAWVPIIEGIGGKSGNAALNASSGMTRPLSPTSAESTSVQSSPGASTAKARTGDQTAGRPSQSTNVTESIAQEIGIGSLFGNTEMTPAGEQGVMPGMDKEPPKTTMERKTEGGLKAKAPQKESAGPLFDDYQTDLLEHLRLQRADANVQKAMDLEGPILGVANCMARRA